MPKNTPKRPTLFSSFKQRLFNKFIKNKHLKNSITLEHRTIYVLPSTLGWYFILVAALNYIMGTNYQNNLILVMSYLMMVMSVITILMGYSNAKGLTIKFKSAHPNFAPLNPTMQFLINSTHLCKSVDFIYQGNVTTQFTMDEVTTEPALCTLTLPYNQRGHYLLARVKIKSNYPFGLVTVWSYIQIKKHVLVYPSLEKVLSDTSLSQRENNHDSGIIKETGSEEFESLLPHQPQMGLNRISWKHYAKTQHLLVKDFVDFKATNALFDFNLMSGNTEQRLSQLCYLVCEATDKNIPFVLKLPTKTVSLNTGQIHKEACLTYLSMYDGRIP